MNPILQIAHLQGGYHKEMVVNDVSLEVNEGDFIGVIGPNGSGKTTLLRLLSRTITPRSGTLAFFGKDSRAIGQKEFCRRVAFVSQEYPIQFPFTVEEIVLMGRIPYLGRLQAETKTDKEAAQHSMRLTETLHLQHRTVNELSAGERQRVMLAKALTQGPRILFLDEPTSHLDIGHQIQMLDLLARLNKKEKLTVVMVVHDLNLASLYCNRIVLMNNGSIYKTGHPQEVLTYQNIETVYKTVVVVKTNPLNSKPYVFLISQCQLN